MSEFERRKAEAFLKAKKELDYDDDGEITPRDFLLTKNGRRALGLAALVLFILLAIVFGKPAQASEEEAASIPVDCGQAVCVIPKTVLMALLKGHNETVDEVAKLRAQLRGKARICPGEKES